jgi:GTP-binding protein LepA
MEIVQERLEREFDLDLITTAPNVRYLVTTTDGVTTEIDSPAKMPEAVRIGKIEEPVIKAVILTPDEYLGASCRCWKKNAGRRKVLSTSPRTG